MEKIELRSKVGILGIDGVLRVWSLFPRPAQSYHDISLKHSIQRSQYQFEELSKTRYVTSYY